MEVAILSSARWALFRLSKQFTARALAEEGHDVLYVDPPVSLASVARDASRLRELFGRGDERPAPQLQVWHPRVAPGQNSAVGQLVNAGLLRRGVLRRLAHPELVIAFSLEARGVLSRLPGRHVYYATDSQQDLPGNDADQVDRWERRLIGDADLVVACSLPLCEQLSTLGADPLYLPHAVEDADLADPGPPPPDLADLPQPLVGYVGSLNFRIDERFLHAAQRAAKGGTLVLIGDSFGPDAAPGVHALRTSDGVAMIGHRGGDQLRAYLAALDVGVVPYSSAPFNRKSFPLKVLQYLAVGTPVVSTPNGATDELGPTVHVATDPASFEALVSRALGENSPAEQAARRAVAASRTWRDNARTLLDACR